MMSARSPPRPATGSSAITSRGPRTIAWASSRACARRRRGPPSRSRASSIAPPRSSAACAQLERGPPRQGREQRRGDPFGDRAMSERRARRCQADLPVQPPAAVRPRRGSRRRRSLRPASGVRTPAAIFASVRLARAPIGPDAAELARLEIRATRREGRRCAGARAGTRRRRPRAAGAPSWRRRVFPRTACQRAPDLAQEADPLLDLADLDRLDDRARDAASARRSRTSCSRSGTASSLPERSRHARSAFLTQRTSAWDVLPARGADAEPQLLHGLRLGVHPLRACAAVRPRSRRTSADPARPPPSAAPPDPLGAMKPLIMQRRSTICRSHLPAAPSAH